ncbi:MAG: NeuD/PglB/VioB family sugar acetyltransferase [Deltaproteobacteria bacterium]|nr:NeuD/PglB/VioB family sugar acetyltransferase [Deltaproteobacteria bacterium]MBW1952464.1 NeuD/PglB/VioB family sugar acetyltransferase [Deltaproteobacteria bacterium]MBW1987393.1 NeuD/PglB/VioB family sugar acetyltransferase [Deltaproteobacteria bacterium]MBW2135176.1 NeuD/PglB/VioB family sugar acetyltransferase [Deltaproteobacteria bacterium]
MNKLIIVGAGGFGRDLLSWVQAIPTQERDWELAGFLDDNPEALKGYSCNLPIMGNIKDYRPRKDDRLVMGVASPTSLKLEIAQQMLNKGANFISIIHPTVVKGINIKIGQGCVICPYALIGNNNKIGDFVTINVFTSIGHDVIVGDGCTFHTHISISGFVKLGRGVEVGSHGCIIPHIKVGEFAKVSAGSAVFANVKPGITVIGVPAKKL